MVQVVHPYGTRNVMHKNTEKRRLDPAEKAVVWRPWQKDAKHRLIYTHLANRWNDRIIRKIPHLKDWMRDLGLNDFSSCIRELRPHKIFCPKRFDVRDAINLIN